MRKYRVNVNGTFYEIEIEAIGGPNITPANPVAYTRTTGSGRASEPVRPAAPVMAAVPIVPAAQTVTGGDHIFSPMPGNILEVLVSVGQSVKKGQNLIMLEAMKMETEILAPHDGVLTSVSVQKGDSVNTGDLLCVLK